ncbi:peptidoglycan-binding domain-containing protein [Vibrio crassostreae]|uniref:peptidoglycan-binding domain-containing protein n=1 Tax=Vibrio crassostreae TaxID=246167 RepID=UPI0010519AD3|nr:peptidoglycan-binding domain-containing protein [Vibrio crassostreae]TCT66769.1 putative peptidoglycan binding protein [Vibrio crassostreae]
MAYKYPPREIIDPEEVKKSMVESQVRRSNAAIAEYEERERRRSNLLASLPKETKSHVNNEPVLKSTLLKNEENMNALGKGSFSSLSMGMKSFEVLKAQEALKEVNVYQGKVDGSFGSKTEQAVKSFQQTYPPTHTTHAQYNLDKTDGVVGRNAVLALDEAIVEQWDSTFHLGWMQSPVTQSQDELWASLFTDGTQPEQQQFIKQCNAHLNDPVREGEIVVLPTFEPKNPEDQKWFDDLLEQAKIASDELGKLLAEEVVTLNRHFDLLSHQLYERIDNDGLPEGYHALAGMGVGVLSSGVTQHLNNIKGVLLEINDLYVSQVAMASKTGGINNGSFIGERAALFKKLDGSFAGLSKRSVNLSIYTQVKRGLNLSTKSVIHNADEILKTGVVKELGKRIGNIAIGISAARGLGYVGLLVGAVSGVDNAYDACKVDGSGECGKTISRELGGFIGGLYGGVEGGAAGAALFVLVVGVTASAPALAIAAISGAVIGGAVGGVAGSTAGKWVVDEIYAWSSNDY